MRKVTDKTEFIIGIDFGHGETSAAYYDLKNQDKKDLDILRAQKVIKSAVAILEQEGQLTICVGESAINNAPFAKDFQISFKKRPSEMNEIEKVRMIAFMKGVYAGILETHPDYKIREHVVYIARPSQDRLWASEERVYLALAEKAGIPVAGIQKESRAAYFRARTQPDSKIDNHVKDGVLIVDFGSSTIDFTYLNETITVPIDDGYPLGACEVEKILLEYAMAHPYDTLMPKFAKLYESDKESNPYNQLLYQFRVAKENFYKNNSLFFQVLIDYTDITSSDGSPITGLGKFSVPKAMVNVILGQDSKDGYIERVREAVKSFKTEKLKSNKVACVYLTGGASRMDFVREIFMDVFNLDAIHCPSDDNPSLIVSQGIAHLSYADIMTADRERKLKYKIDKLISEFPWNARISSIIKGAVKNEIKSSAHKIMIKWRDGEIYEYRCGGVMKYHNLNSLKRAFDNLFISFNGLDLIPKCASVINSELMNSILNEIKDTFSAYSLTFDDDFCVSISELKASLSSKGIEVISQKFTGNGPGHIIYDSIASRNIVMQNKLNMIGDRFDNGRLMHYLQYPYDIFSEDDWNKFLNGYLIIRGIEEVKEQVKSKAEALLYKFVQYAKLAIFFK